MITPEEKNQCKTCKYRTGFTAFSRTIYVCQYIMIKKKRRPSPTGILCKEYEKGNVMQYDKNEKIYKETNNNI